MKSKIIFFAIAVLIAVLIFHHCYPEGWQHLTRLFFKNLVKIF